jgi:HEAT repeat protein
MIELVPLLPIAFGAVGLWAAILHRRRRLQAWREAAAACGLQNAEVSNWPTQVTARAGPLTVRIETCGNKGRYTRITVSVPGSPDFHGVSIRREPLVRWARETEVGDSQFDGTFFLEGPARQVLALLDAEMRRLLIEANAEGRLEVSRGSLQVESLSDRQVPHVLPLLLEIGRRLAQPMDVLQRLTENAHRDDEPGVRLQNLLLLIRELPENQWTLEALRTACADPSPAIRLRAAKALGAEGRAVLLALAEGLADDTVSAEAVSTLERELPFERTEAILSHALRWRRLQTARVCLDLLGSSGEAAAVDALAKVIGREKSELASAAALALGATGSPAAEQVLIEALLREEADLRVAAANALGRVGSVAAVLPLEEAAGRSWLDLDLRRATRQAIAEIQSRLPGASPGQLSLAGTDTGQLSLAPDGAGHLSLAPGPAGQLSLAQAESGPFALPSDVPGHRPQPAREGPGGRGA